MNNLQIIAYLREELFDAKQEIKELKEEHVDQLAAEGGWLSGGGHLYGPSVTLIDDVKIKYDKTAEALHDISKTFLRCEEIYSNASEGCKAEIKDMVKGWSTNG